MGRLIYSAIVSLDGYLADASGDFSWAVPDPEVHAFINDLERPVGTYLYGRRMYDVMSEWQRAGTDPGDSPQNRDFGEIWRAADKIVYSTRLGSPRTPKTTVQRSFDPGKVRELVASADRDVTVGGPTLAAEALRANLVHEIHLFLVPTVVGGGLAVLPDGLRLDLRLVEGRAFRKGFAYLRYEVTPRG